MTPWAWTLVWFVGFVASLAAHELAHVWIGKRNGWDYLGVTVKPSLLGVGVKMGAPTHNDSARHVCRVALAGPLASLACAWAFLVGVMLTDGSGAAVFFSLCAVNFVIALVNLIPAPITDGGLAWRAWRAR